jgi:ligand-binding SRPBCC domain-containing protein
MSKVYSLKTTQLIPTGISTAWDFFSNPSRLQDITPADMGFTITSKYQGDKIYAGQIIEYRLRPLLGIPVYWMTEITHVEDKKYFVDEQRFGPYSLWHHQHHFKEVSGGVEMTDIVHYKIPFGFIGDISNRLFVGHKLKQIFDYRYAKVEEMFVIK